MHHVSTYICYDNKNDIIDYRLFIIYNFISFLSCLINNTKNSIILSGFIILSLVFIVYNIFIYRVNNNNLIIII